MCRNGECYNTRMVKQLNVRLASANDVDGMHDLGKDVAEFAVTDNTVTFWPKSVLARAVNSDDVVVLVAETDSIAGFLIAQYSDGLKKAVIENIFVRPDMRKRNMGDMLLKRALEVLRDKGCEFVATLVPSGAQAAAGLYEKHGFRQGPEPFLWLDKSLSAAFDKKSG